MLSLESACSSATFPSMQNGYYPSTIMTATGYYNYYTCNYGYSSSGGSAWPYSICTLSGSVYTWNTVYNCTCALLTTFEALEHAFPAASNSSVNVMCAGNPMYCPATGPSLANANTPPPNQGYRQNTSFVCNTGYQSNGGAISPYYTCLSSSNSAGVYSPVAYSCVGALKMR